MKFMQKQLAKSKSKKGFTLVEVIVVLVILAILAAILVPSMVGWIHKAEQKTVLVEARSALLALQTIASEEHDGDASDVAPASAKSLAELTGTISDVTASGDTITGFKYTDGTYTATYEAGAFTVA